MPRWILLAGFAIALLTQAAPAAELMATPLRGPPARQLSVIDSRLDAICRAAESDAGQPIKPDEVILLLQRKRELRERLRLPRSAPISAGCRDALQTAFSTNNVEPETRQAFDRLSASTTRTKKRGKKKGTKNGSPEREVGPLVTDLPGLFPWPPPAPSAQRALSLNVVSGMPPAANLGDIADRLKQQLQAARYDSWSYFNAPGGFALVTRMERLDPGSGRPLSGDQRWSTQLASAGFSIRNLLSLSRPTGVYRTLVFVVTDDPQMTERRGPDEMLDIMRRWAAQGRPTLPRQIRDLPVRSDHALVLNIYEIEKTEGAPAQQPIPSRWSIETHLEGSSLVLGTSQ
jgi:hypothetical protein